MNTLGVVYLLIYNIAKKAGQIEKDSQTNKANKGKESKIKVISTEDVSTDNSTGMYIMQFHQSTNSSP